MSLLNDVMRDLERRGASPAGEPRPALAAKRRGAGIGRVVVIGLLAAIVAALVLRFGFEFGDRGPASPAERTQLVSASRPAAPPSSNDGAIVDASPGARAPTGPAFPDRPPVDAPAGEALADAELIERPGERSLAATSADAGPEPALTPDLAATAADAVEGRLDPPPRSRAAPPEVAEAPARPRSEKAPAAQSKPPAAPTIVIRRLVRADASAVERARRMLGQDRIEHAEMLLVDSIEAGTGDVEAWRLLARIRADQGRTEKALQTLAQARQRFDDDPALIVQQARLLLDAGRSEAAVGVLSGAPPAPEHADHHLLWAAALRRLGRHEQALARYRALLAVDGSNAQAWLGQALSLDALGRTDDARRAYGEAERLGDADTARFASRRRAALARAATPSRSDVPSRTDEG